MAEKIVMLALSPTMERGTIAKWHVKEGDIFSEGDVLCEVETDKATMDYEATGSGTIRKIIISDKENVNVGDLIAIAADKDEDISSLLTESEIKGKSPHDSVEKTEVRSDTGTDLTDRKSPAVALTRLPAGVKASPLARKIAQQKGIALSALSGSGPGGRIVKDDVEKALQTGNAVKGMNTSRVSSEKDSIIPFSDKRHVIAERLSASKQEAPHFYLTVKAVMDELIEARAQLNANTEKRISFNAILIKLVAEALRRNPQINVSYRNDATVQHGRIDIALAVAQSDGLVTPIVRDAVHKGFQEISDELKDLIKRAREGNLTLEEYSDSTFTISNLGSFGVHQFTAIINPPNAAILAVGEIFREPFEKKDGTVGFRSAMFMTLSCDHRIVDGAVAAVFANDLKRIVEHPVVAML